MAEVYRISGVDKLLYLPPFENAMNTVDWLLSMGQYKNWAGSFLGIARLKEHQSAVFGPEFNLFSRSHSVMGMTYSYDRDIRLKGVSK